MSSRISNRYGPKQGEQRGMTAMIWDGQSSNQQWPVQALIDCWYYQWPGVWNILTFGYIIQQPLHSRPPNFVQLWIRISWTWIYFLIFNCTVVEADRGFPVVEGDCFRRLKWLSRRSHIQLSEFDRVNASDLGFRRSYLISHHVIESGGVTLTSEVSASR